MHKVCFISTLLSVLFVPVNGYAQSPAAAIEALSPDMKLWVNFACPKRMRPSQWSKCVRQEIAAISKGLPDYSNLPKEDQKWVSLSCPSALVPSRYVSCVKRELAALSAGMPDTSELSAQQRLWLKQLCPSALSPSEYRSCVSQELQGFRSELN